MPSLLTDGEFAEIRAVIQDVTDTFHKKPITYYVKGVSLDIHNEDRGNQVLASYSILGLVVWEKTSDDSEVLEKNIGNLDLTHGYVNFNFDDCDVAGMIVDDKFIGKADNHEYIEFDGERYKVIGIVPIGQFPVKESLVRVIFEKIIRNGA